MISVSTYEYLRTILSARLTEYPELMAGTFASGFVPEMYKCQLTSAQVAVEHGLVPVVGIDFLEKSGKLYPWPHIVNQTVDGRLVDFSPRINEPRIGFIRTGWEEWRQWRAVTGEYITLMPGTGIAWGDPLADRLSSDFLHVLRARLAPSAPHAPLR